MDGRRSERERIKWMPGGKRTKDAAAMNGVDRREPTGGGDEKKKIALARDEKERGECLRVNEKNNRATE